MVIILSEEVWQFRNIAQWEESMNEILKSTVGYMTCTALLGIFLGLVMIFYPGGTMLLISSAFWVFQLLISLFILYYALSESAHYFRSGSAGHGFLYLLIGMLAVIFVWLLDVSFVYFVVAFFLIIAGLGEIAGSINLPGGSMFLALLGIVNIIIAVLILANPIVLPMLIAWYVLFWGISRLLFSIELRRILELSREQGYL